MNKTKLLILLLLFNLNLFSQKNNQLHLDGFSFSFGAQVTNNKSLTGTLIFEYPFLKKEQRAYSVFLGGSRTNYYRPNDPQIGRSFGAFNYSFGGNISERIKNNNFLYLSIGLNDYIDKHSENRPSKDQFYAFANFGLKKLTEKFILKIFFVVNRDIDYSKYVVSVIKLATDRNEPRNRFVGLGMSAGYYF